MTRSSVYKTQFTLVEARVLYELGAHGAHPTGGLRRKLAIDAGQLSQVLKRLETDALIERTPADGRSQRGRG